MTREDALNQIIPQAYKKYQLQLLIDRDNMGLRNSNKKKNMSTLSSDLNDATLFLRKNFDTSSFSGIPFLPRHFLHK